MGLVVDNLRKINQKMPGLDFPAIKLSDTQFYKKGLETREREREIERGLSLCLAAGTEQERENEVFVWNYWD